MTVQNPSTNFGWDLPVDGASSGVWGPLLNAIFAEDSDAGALDFGIDKVVGDIKTTADAALARGGGVMTGEIDLLTERYTLVTTATSGTVTLDMETGNFFALTPSATVTLVFSNPVGSGEVGFLQIEITNGTAQTVNWPSSVDWPGGTEPTLTAGVDLITGYTRDGGTTWRLALAMSNSS